MPHESNDEAAGDAGNPFHVPMLATSRLVVRELSSADLDAVHDIFTAIGWNSPHLTPDAARRARSTWLSWTTAGYRELEKLYQPPLGERAIVEQATGRVVGLVGYVPSFGPFGRMPFLHSRPDAASTMELGLFWAVSPAAQRRGFATEAAGALVRHAFDRLSADRIIATTEYENVRSISVMRRLGMRVERYPGSHPGLKVVGFLERGGY